MSLLLRLERKQKNSLKPFRNRIFFFLSSSFGIETINMFIHSRSSLENHTWFQTKISKIYTHFQTKKVQKPYPPPPPLPGCQAWGLGGIPGNFWQGCAAHFSKSWRIFRPDVDRNYFRIELKKKGFLKCISNSHLTLSFWLIWNWYNKINTFTHYRSFLENHTQFQTEMTKSIPVFTIKWCKNHTLWGSTYL